MAKFHVRIRAGGIELDVKAEGKIDGEAIELLKQIVQPFASALLRNNNRTELNRHDVDNFQQHKHSSIYSSFKETVLSVFRYGQWFTSSDAGEAYMDLHDVRLKKPTVITYLRRMEREGILVSKRHGRMIKFRLAPHLCGIPQEGPNRIIIYDSID